MQMQAAMGGQILIETLVEQALVHPALSELFENSHKRGFITYEELNTTLPDEMVDPDALDRLLVLLDRRKISLVDSSRAKLPTRLEIQDNDDSGKSDSEADSSGIKTLKAELVQALQEGGNKRIDDPVRMYLTQMGEISLLTREEEIRLAKKIETTRMIFRRKVLENDYCIQSAEEILDQVHQGNLPFDRTMKVSTAQEDAKGRIAARMPTNLKTIRRMLELNRQDWESLEQSKKNAKQIDELYGEPVTVDDFELLYRLTPRD